MDTYNRTFELGDGTRLPCRIGLDPTSSWVAPAYSVNLRQVARNARVFVTEGTWAAMLDKSEGTDLEDARRIILDGVLSRDVTRWVAPDDIIRP